MSFRMNRRLFMQATSSAIAAGTLSSVTGRASAQSSGGLRVLVGGGDWGKANMEAYVKPFEAATGIKVTPITDEMTAAQLELMMKTKNIAVDVWSTNQSAAFIAAEKGYLESIDYSIYQKDQLDGIVDFAKMPYGVAALIYSTVMVYNTLKYPANKPRPTTWAEFWDVERFPGARALASGINGGGASGPWEEALLASGVAPDALYPVDIDRIFASLEKIKPHVRKWWEYGSEVQQIMRDKVADVVSSFDGRAQFLIDQGAPLEINRNQAKVTWDFWVIAKGSPNAQNAQKFIEFATRADRQAAFAQLMPYGPSNLNAYKLIPEKVAVKLASHPNYLKNSIPVNGKWYTEIGQDGVTNSGRLLQRWNSWILQ
ncbi:ABC transporter substrate-binding protein (plasmid) [Microvirga sp. RSM25]|uniref:ABC transporter substrate-binding protein n=1 Tax=Microvirga sp. RSM25 TaxID=3273802 RepID=UPI00384FF30D